MNDSINVALVDVCHTLYAVNTTFDFLAWHLGEHPEFLALQQKRHSLAHRIRSKVIGGEDEIRTQSIALLQGARRIDLAASAQAYVRQLAPIVSTRDHVEQRLSEGTRVYLVSSSLDIIVSAIAAEVGVSGWYASQLGFEDDVCTGVLRTDLTASKDQIIDEHFSGEQIEFISDNFSDANCINKVRCFRPVFMRRDVRARAFWLAKSTAEPILYG